MKQAIRAECARKAQSVKSEYEYSKNILNQQLTDFQVLLEERSTEKEELISKLASIEAELKVQDRKRAQAEQQASDNAQRFQEAESKLD